MSKNKHQKQIQKKVMPQGGDLPTAEAVKLLKDKILEEVRLCSNGRKVTVYELFEMGKELLILEEQLEKETHGDQSTAASDLHAEF